MKNGDLPAMIGEYEYQFKNGDTKTFKGSGLTKREQFAMAVAQGILSNEIMIDNMDSASIDWVAKRSVSMADALLAELERAK